MVVVVFNCVGVINTQGLLPSNAVTFFISLTFFCFGVSKVYRAPVKVSPYALPFIL